MPLTKASWDFSAKQAASGELSVRTVDNQVFRFAFDDKTYVEREEELATALIRLIGTYLLAPRRSVHPAYQWLFAKRRISPQIASSLPRAKPYSSNNHGTLCSTSWPMPSSTKRT